MKKRKFLQALLASSGAALAMQGLLPRPRALAASLDLLNSEPAVVDASSDTSMADAGAQADVELGQLQSSELQAGFKHSERGLSMQEAIAQLPDDAVEAYLEKIRNFDAHFSNDVVVSASRLSLLQLTLARLDRVQNYVGHANFNLLSFDDTLFYARNYPVIGAFEKAELEFMDEIFHADASAYGFFGEKITPRLTHRSAAHDVEKVGRNGHCLLKGESLNHYRQIERDVGDQLLLTSGIRNNVKQMHLFLAKANLSDGNLSKASRSLAPPGYSFHNAGDFDVGKIGLGSMNFTADFSNTDEFRRLSTLGYVDIRSTDSNQYGVRYEPWHIKLNCSEKAHTCA